MQLSSLLAELPDLIQPHPAGLRTLPVQPDKLGLEITGITADSRSVVPGALFVAYQGVDHDGHQYIGDAIARGAAAVVGEKPVSSPSAPYVQVSNGRAALAWLSAAWYGHPSRAMALVGVTGTDGKTTTSNLLFSILKAAGRRAGLISTVNAIMPADDAGIRADKVYDTGLHTTTPDAPDVQRYLALMRDAETEVVVLEATSHGLAQHRLTGCAFDVGVITNLTHEHLDFHGSHEAYLDAKAMLFRSLMSSSHKIGVAKTSVLNRDDPSFAPLSAIPVERIVTYGVAGRLAASAPSKEFEKGEGSPSQHLPGQPRGTLPRQPRGTSPAREVPSRDVRSLALTAVDVQNTPSGTAFDIELSSEELAGSREHWSISTPLIGMFNVYNILAASAAALALGVDVSAIQAGVQSLVGIPGRMERVDRGQGFMAVVDFAHTPNALAEALRTARDQAATGGRVIAVFGCAGLRDRQKRWLMGEVAARLADITVITAEDPRTEELDAIMAETAAALAEGGRSEGSDFVRVADRQLAILYAVRQARSGDVVIICGKGHERSMCFGVTEYPWGDREALAWALDVEMGRSSPPPFVLPTWKPL